MLDMIHPYLPLRHTLKEDNCHSIPKDSRYVVVADVRLQRPGLGRLGMSSSM